MRATSMKKYITPTVEIVLVSTVKMIAASGDTTEVTISDNELNNVTFGSRSNNFWDDDE